MTVTRRPCDELTGSPWAEAYLRTKWHLDPSSRLATIHGPKSGGAAVPFFGEGQTGHHLIVSPGPKPTSVTSGILIQPAVWPQQTCVENWEGQVLVRRVGAGSEVIVAKYYSL